MDAIKNNQVPLVINAPSGKESQEDDSYIRKAAMRFKVPYVTTSAAALAAAKGMSAQNQSQARTVRSLQDYHADLR